MITRFLSIGIGLVAAVLPANGQTAWEAVAAPTHATLRSVAYGGGRFVAVGDQGTVLTSADGSSWTEQASGAEAQLNGIAYGPAGFAAVGDASTFLVSSDGANWRAMPPPYDFGELRGICEGWGVYVVAGTNTGAYFTRDGRRWVWSGYGRSEAAFNAVARTPAGYFSVGDAGWVSGPWRHPAEEYLDSRTQVGTANYRAVAAGGRIVVAIGDGGARVRWKSDYAVPTFDHLPVREDMLALTFADGVFIGAGRNGTVLTSRDGEAWSVQAFPSPVTIRGLAASADTIVAVGDDGAILRSSLVALPPVITQPPADVVQRAGSGVGFRVVATGAPGLTYQWYHDGRAIAGATTDEWWKPSGDTADSGTYAVEVSNPVGNVRSADTTLRVTDDPGVALTATTVLSVVPTFRQIAPGESAPFDLHIVGPDCRHAVINFRSEYDPWHGGVSAVDLPFVAGATNGYYAVEYGRGASDPMFVQVASTTAPELASDAATETVNLGRALLLTIPTPATADMTVQWQHDGVDLPGETRDTMDLQAPSVASGGDYTAIVTNSAGSSRYTVHVSVLEAPVLANVSARAFAGPGDETLIVGFVLDGLPHYASKHLLARAVGATLRTWGIQNPLPDPKLAIFARSTPVVRLNDDWDDPGAPRNLMESWFGAGFPLQAGSGDAALQDQFTADAYTMHVSGKGRGVALAEIYDSPELEGKLVNVSCRAVAGSGERTLIVGFVFKGSGTARVLVRALGPTLADFGVTRVSTHPAVSLFDGSGAPIASSTDWRSEANADAIRATSLRVGAVPATATAAEGALLVDLPAGAYTAHLVPADGPSGVALLEVYVVE